MVRLNRNVLNKKQLDALFQQLAVAISPDDVPHANQLLTELLGREERIMLAKRLAVVVLLVESTSQYKISRLLKLSESTVGHMAKKMKRGHFNHTLRKISKTKKDYFVFLETLDKILHLGGVLPHYNGLDRYRFLDH